MFRFIFIAICMLPVLGKAQKALPILGADFVGLKKTKPSYLRTILDLDQDKEIQLEHIDQFIQRLNNLSNITKATYRLDSIANGQLIIFDIEEAQTIFPIVNFGGIRGNFWYQVGFTDINWLGKGNQLSLFYQNNDRRNNYSLYYRFPYINGSRWGGSLSFLRWASTEPLYFDEGAVFYDYSNLSFSATAIYEFSLGHNLEFGGNYFIENYEKTPDQDLEDPPGPDGLRQPKLLGKVIHRINRINYDYHKQDGIYNMLILETVYNTLDQSWFFIMLNDFHHFRPLGLKGNIALRLRIGISTNDDTPFAPFVLDSNINIRGSGNRIDRGTAAFILNLEYRYDLWNKPAEDFATQVVFFSDIGTWRNPGGNFNDLFNSENFRHFIGGGFRLVYKKAFNAILRIDYGVDIYNLNQRGFVAGIGQYF